MTDKAIRVPHVPVIVVGAGPTGITAATLLAQYGVRCVVLDRWPGLYPQPRAVHLDDEIFRIIARLGIADEFAAISRPTLGLRLLDNRRMVLAEFTRDPARSVHGFPQANMFDQPELEALLRMNLKRCPGVELRGDAEVTELAEVTDHGRRVRVTFMDGSTALGSATLSGGKARFKTTSLAAGSQAITAVYGGDGNFSTSKSVVLTQTVQQDATTTNLKSSANPSVFGQSVTFTATVKAASPGSGTPSGTVTFYDGSTTLGTATLDDGTASFTTSSLSVGSHSIKVSYGGGADFKASTSAVLKQSVRASTSSSAAQLVDQALSALPDDDAPTVGSTVHDLALEQVSVRDRRPHRSHWRLS